MGGWDCKGMDAHDQEHSTHVSSAQTCPAATPLAVCHAFCWVAHLHTQIIPQEEFARASPRNISVLTKQGI